MPNEWSDFSKQFKAQKKAAREAQARERRKNVKQQLMDYYGARRWRAEPGSTLAGLRTAVHKAYDPLWEFEIMSRDEVYRRLALVLRLPRQITHVGMFDEALCRRALAVRNDPIFKKED